MPNQTVGKYPPSGMRVGDSHYQTDLNAWQTWDGGSWTLANAGGLIGSPSSSVFKINTDGSITGTIGAAAKGFSITGTSPASVAGAGTSAGTFWSVVAPNGGASSGAAGGTGGALSWTTGAAGASFSGAAVGGDAILNLGVGTGTGRNGEFQVNTTWNNTYTDTDVQQATWTQTVNLSGATNSNFHGLVSNMVLNGGGANWTNVGAATNAGYFTCTNNTTGTFNIGSPQALAANHIWLGTGTMTVSQAAEFYISHQSNGTITLGVGVVSTSQTQNMGVSGVWTQFIGYDVNQNGTGKISNLVGYRVTGANFNNEGSGTSTTGGYFASCVQMAIPAQGGNTSLTNNNIAFEGRGGGGVAGAGGTVINIVYSSLQWGASAAAAGARVDNYTALFYVPNGTGTAGISGTNNYGIRIQGNGGSGANQTSWAFRSDSTANSSFLGSLALGTNTAATTGTLLQVTGGTTAAVSTVNFTGSAVAAGAPLLTMTPGAHTAVVAEVIDYNHAAHTNVITGGYATQRFTLFTAPTISAATSLTVTTAATVAISGAPTAAGAGPAVITNPIALWVQAGLTSLDGQTALGRAYHKMATNNGLISTSSAQGITLTAAILVGGFLEHTVTTGAATDTLDTGTNISAAIPGAAVGDSFVFTLVNKSASAFAITLTGATGSTIQGTPSTVAQNRSAILTFVNTGSNTWDVFVSVSA